MDITDIVITIIIILLSLYTAIVLLIISTFGKLVSSGVSFSQQLAWPANPLFSRPIELELGRQEP